MNELKSKKITGYKKHLNLSMDTKFTKSNLYNSRYAQNTKAKIQRSKFSIMQF